MKPSIASHTRNRIRREFPNAPDKFTIVDIASQKMYLIDDTVPIRTYAISTSHFGVGSREGSNQTPLGIHRIVEKIGAGAPEGRIFRGRCDTGIDWYEGLTEENLVVTRILRLEGLESGVNRGPGIDSFVRNIYIHGTNRESSIGTPFSSGCICMKNRDILELYDSIEEGAIIFIY